MKIKRISKIVVSIFCFATLILGCCSCSSSPKDFTGKWAVTEVSFSDSALADEIQLLALETTYNEMTLQLNEDNTGSLYYLNKDNQITWELKDGKHWDTINIYMDGVLWKEFEVTDENNIWLTLETDIVIASVSFSKVENS